VLILGLDPGSRHTGYGLVRTADGSLRAVDYGRFSCPPSQPVANRLAGLTQQLREFIDRRQPDVAVLETPFHGLNTRSLVVLAQARGALLAILAERGIEIGEYSPAEVKSAVTGQGRATKDQVARMVRLQLSLQDEKISPDASDALAMAICFAQRHRMDRLIADSR
jgi:crossover junction endodeoxyribonuclease RuvC